MRIFLFIMLVIMSSLGSAEEKKSLAVELFKVSGEFDAVEMAKQEGIDTLVKMDASLSKNQAKAFYDMIYNSSEIEAIYISEVPEHLTHAELKEIIKFFSSDIGKKYIQANMAISRLVAQSTNSKMSDLSNP